ncbi:PPOX class F420-dependent oxidoreductase [Naumannella halotolerans]|uniref:PPOX class probable F420-dependent enzyme n=1 Tax=Naumannella halotolerans TaxID=993414 RepID=A0A4R7J0F7_9ACTN|nr:PPOX class F420-dependent oxidoreductase [Naumannella halotolerans]TDT29846.1 PPOX class probable F420-dependent enzyme [Naumannella halotolerans]
MPRTIADLTPDALAFLAERHLGVVTTLRADGSPQVVAVGFTYDPESGLARVITSGDSSKVRNAERRTWAVLSQVDGRRWLSLEGTARVLTDPSAVADAEARYAQRYRVPRPNPKRVVIEVTIERVLGSRMLFEEGPGIVSR